MKSSELAQQVTEGGNLLGVFLCTHALRTLRAKGSAPEVVALLAEGVLKYAPAFRAMQRLVHGASDVEPALVRLQALVRLGLDLDRPEHVADVRAAIRELLSGLGFSLPYHAAGPGVACELHGAACPTAGDDPGGARAGEGRAREGGAPRGAVTPARGRRGSR